MISICVLFYPFYRKTERTSEVFDVLVRSLNRCVGSEDLELSIVDAGVEDIWGYNRRHDSARFLNLLERKFRGKLRYLLSPECLYENEKGGKAFWGSMAVNKAVENSTYENIFIAGIDCYFPKRFIEKYSERVYPKKVWVIRPHAIPKGAPFKHFNLPGFGYHGARGIIGIKREDWNKLGGYDTKYILRSSDSDFYNRMAAAGYELILERVPDFYHVGHPGSNFCNTKNWRWENVLMSVKNFPEEHLLLHLVKTRKLKVVAEIGVLSGTLVTRVLSNAGETVERYLAVDPWRVYIESYDRPPHAKEKDQNWWNSIYERVVALKDRFPQLEIMRLSSIEAAKKLREEANGQLDIVYIDSVHDLPNIVNDVYFWSFVLKDNGIISGHDFTKRYIAMSRGLLKIFGDDLNVMILDENKPALSYKNTYQGGNWWVELTKEKKAHCQKLIEKKYGHLLERVD